MKCSHTQHKNPKNSFLGAKILKKQFKPLKKIKNLKCRVKTGLLCTQHWMWLFVLAREALMEVSTTSNASLSPSGCAFTVQHTSWIHFLHLHTRSLFWGSGLSDHQSSKHKSAQELRPASLASIKKKINGDDKVSYLALSFCCAIHLSALCLWGSMSHRIQLSFFFSTGAWRGDKAQCLFEDK